MGERLIAIFFLGAFLFNPLCMRLFDRGAGSTVFGVPLFFFYLFGGWTLLIVLLAGAIEGPGGRESNDAANAGRVRRGRQRAQTMTGHAGMLPAWLIVFTSVGYVSLLFGIAYYGDRRAVQGKTLVANPYIYALSIAVYCTAWTFYGSVGRAARSGVDYLTIYIGPTLMFALGWVILRKMIRISKVNHITSIADFISSRYGKSHLLGGLVTIIAVVGIMPYISLQLKAVASSFTVLLNYPALSSEPTIAGLSLLGDTALWIAALMALFAILFGTRHIDATEHHQGLVAAIAFELVVKLVAFVSVGVFVTFGIFDGFGDLFQRAASLPQVARLMTMDATVDWAPLTLLAMAAIICLPRQFQVSVVENVDEKHLNKAIWLFPLYLLVINLFVLPIAFAGLILFPAGLVDADTFVLALPMADHQPYLALFAFIGGLSAATGMVIVETVALSTMISNDLVMPMLLRFAWLHLAERRDLSGLLLSIRRGAICFILLIGYLYFRLIGESYALVSIGLMSFAAAAQFAPAPDRRDVLEGRVAPRRTRRHLRRLRDLDLHPAVAVVRPLRLAADELRRERPVRHRRCSSPTACSASHYSIQSPMPCSGACWSTSALSSPFRCSTGRAPSSGSRRRCSSRCSSMRRHAPPPPGCCTAPFRCASFAPWPSSFSDASGRKSCSPNMPAAMVSSSHRCRWPTASSSSSSSGGWPAPSVRRRPASWSPRPSRAKASASTRSCRSSTRPRRSWSTAGSSSRSRRRWRRPRPSSKRRTPG